MLLNMAFFNQVLLHKGSDFLEIYNISLRVYIVVRIFYQGGASKFDILFKLRELIYSLHYP